MAKSNKKYKKLNSHSVEKMNKLAKIKERAATITNGDSSKEIKLDLDELAKDEEKTIQMENDTNMLVITSSNKSKKNRKHNEEDDGNMGRVVETKKKKLTRKEKLKLEKVLERKDKSSRRGELLEKLAIIQIKPGELNLYSSVKNIGQKETRKDGAKFREINLSADIINEPRDGIKRTKMNVNSVSGSNKQKNKKIKSEETQKDSELDTDDMSTDSEIDLDDIHKALEQHKLEQSIKNLEEFKQSYKSNHHDSSGEEDDPTRVGRGNGSSNIVTKYVHVERREEIKDSRSKLPIITEEQSIMEKINENDIVIICGETGSGKTTQVPQFLYEAGYAENGKMIGITEPRRVAAISMSKRVNDEMNFKEEDSVVSYQIRYDGNWNVSSTRIKFMTDGVLLKEVQMDFMLSKYSAIIIDEAHERSVYTDILIGLLSRIVPLRAKRGNPLKLIIMSATLRVEDFTENDRLFKRKELIPPVIKVDSRQFSVAVHFNKHTYDDYLAEAFRKVCKIHRRLPEGGILVFVTGQQEVNVLCNKLKKTFPNKTFKNNVIEDSNNLNDNENKKVKINSRKKKSNTNESVSLKDASTVDLNRYSTMPLDEELEIFDEASGEKNVDDEVVDEMYNFNNNDEDVESETDDEDAEDPHNPLNSTKGQTKRSNNSEKPLYVLPLYSLLPSDKQVRVFDEKSIPQNSRLCVIATNIAETSLTIPNIKYVVDTGKIKQKFYDNLTGVSTFKICWTSKASADQRAGRAGRTSPGHCYRLYSSAVFNDEFTLFAEPEIVRKPVEDLILQMKDLGIDRIINFPFPTPPDDTSIKIAENLLVQLGALQVDKSKIKNMKDEQITTITKLGKSMACFPINPRYSKMLTLASQQKSIENGPNVILSYIICLISGLSVPELFIDGETVIQSQKSTTDQNKEPLKIKYSQIRQSWLNGVPGSHTMLLGDLMLLLVAMGAVEYEQHVNKDTSIDSNSLNKCMKFCEQYGIRSKAIIEARKLRKQLINTVNIIFPHLNLSIDPMMAPPSNEQAKLLRQLVLSGMVDKIAKRYEYALIGKDGKQIKNAYQSLILEDPIFIHPSSVLFKELPRYVCFIEMAETSKMYMKNLCAIEDSWLPVYLSNQCSFEKPILLNETNTDGEINMQPRFDSEKGVVICYRESTFGKVMWKINAVEVEFPLCLDLYKWFGRFLLEGQVIEYLKKYEPVLLASPSTLLKSWAKLQPRTESFLRELTTNQCYNKEKLCEIWNQKSDFLLNEYLMWIPESIHFELRLKWPPLNVK